jgi:hypothetical protein
VKDFFFQPLEKLLRQQVDCLAEETFQFHHLFENYSLMNSLVSSGVEVILKVRPASSSLETSRIPPEIPVTPVELPNASQPHSTHILYLLV